MAQSSQKAARMLPLSVTSISRPNKISVIRQALHKICKEQFEFNFNQQLFDVHNQRCPYDERETTFVLPQERVVGRDEQVQRILDFLLSPPAAGMSNDGIREWPVILPIFGLPGVGKTTLAKLVYNHPRLRDYFYASVWVYVSPRFDLRRIRASIISKLPRAYDGEGSIDVLDDLDMDSMSKLVGDGRKVLLVLDDIWEQGQQELDRLKSLLGVGTHGISSKTIVIVTTRDEDIARRICTNKLVQPYKLHPLSDDQCLEVFRRACPIEVKSDFQKLGPIGWQIVSTKLGGLPLAAQAAGRMLRNIDSYLEWLDIAATDYHRWDDSFKDGALSLTYQSMPLNLRLCFAFLGTLSDRHNMTQDDIIHRWIALDLIDGISTGHKIISRLVELSFLQLSNLASVSSKTTRKHDDKDVVSFTMHSLVHEFARFVMIISNMLFLAYGEDMNYFGRNRWRYAVWTNVDLAPSEKLSSIFSAELRSLSLLGCSKMELSNDSFAFAKYLQVLELREPSMQKLPDSICQLGLLGYLNLSGCCGLVKLSESFGNLTSLLHINLSGCSGLKNLPKSFGNLTRALHINLSGCHGLDDLPESFCELTNLEYLDLSFCSCLRGLQIALGGTTNLQHLNLSQPSCYALEHKCHLEQLKDVWEKLTKLQYLNMSMFMNPIFCYLEEGESPDYFQSIFKGLSSVEHLDLSHNIFLVDIPEILCALSKLHTLNLSGSIRLKRIAKKITEMKFLRTIILRKCPSLESYSFVVHADNGACSSNLVQLEDIASCKELEISCLEKVKSVEDAKRITLQKKRLEKLALGWTGGCDVTSVDDEALLEELVPPQNLQQFALKGYRGKYLPAWLALHLCLHLSNLEEITMENIPKCHALPPLLLLPKLKMVVIRKMDRITRIDASELSGGGNKAELHRLLKFTLDDMENLQEFNTIYRSGGDEFMFPTIDELVIQNCPNLKFGPFLPRVQRFQISACDQVISSLPKRETAGQGKGVEASSSSTSAAAAPRVTQLVVENCMVPLGDWSLLYHLPGLRSLEIRGCNDLTASQEIIQALSSLQSLHFNQCDGMTFLLEYLGELTSLQELTIDGCQDIESLPGSIDKLSNLKDLCIPGCPKLQEWCKSADNKQKLANIQIRDSATIEPGTTANQTTNKQLTRGQSSLLVTLE